MNGMTTSKLKKKFLMIMAEDKEIFNLIDNKTAEYPDDLLGENLFPQIKIDFTEQEAGTYIGIKIDYPSVSDKNDLYKNFSFTAITISHNSHLKTKTGDSRVDLISEALIRIFNWNEDFGFMLKLKSDTEDPLDPKHYYRRLIFQALDYNSIDKRLENGGY